MGDRMLDTITTQDSMEAYREAQTHVCSWSPMTQQIELCVWCGATRLVVKSE